MVWAMEVAGAAASGVLDGDATDLGGGSTNITTPSYTSTYNGDLYFGACLATGVISSANSPFTGVDAIQAGCYSEYYIQGVHGAQAVDYTQGSSSGSWWGIVAAFIPLQPSLKQEHARFRTDTGAVDATPTWGAAEDSEAFSPPSVPFRFRASISDFSVNAAESQPYELYASKNGGAYSPITTSSTGGVKAASASSDADNTILRTPHLTVPFAVSSDSIAFVGAADGGDVVSASGMTYSYVCGSGSNRLLVVNATGDVTSDIVTGVTYGGVSMSLVGKHYGGGGGDRWQYMFELLNPASGANNIVISASGTCDRIMSVAADYSGAKQSGQPDASITNGSAGGSGTLTTSVTTVADGDWVVLCETGFNVDQSPPGVGAGSTLRVTGSFGSLAIFDSNGPVTPAGSYSMTTLRSLAPGTSSISHVVGAFSHA
jgi:hypothetical protein